MSAAAKYARKSNRLVASACLAVDGLSSLVPGRVKPHILIACMPKSGSTFLATALSEYPGMRHVGLVPARGAREQELCQIRLSRYNHQSYVSQLHLRNSEWTQHLIAKYRLTPVVLVRNLADTVVSIRDHVRNDLQDNPMVFFSDYHKNLPDKELEEAIVRLAIPWWIAFYAGWLTAPGALLMTYDEMVADPARALSRILERTGVPVQPDDVQRALDGARNRNVRFNVGDKGRGAGLSPRAKAALLELLGYYPALADDPLFAATRRTLAE